jgi:hypothetical protein
MYVRTKTGFGEPCQSLQVNSLGACVVPTSVSVRNLLCTAADLAAVSRVVGRPVSEAEVRIAITTAVNRAVRFLLNAAQPLTRPRSRSGDGVIMRLHFIEAFGVAPEFVPTWRPAGARWDLGDVVRERLRCAARVLSNGSIRYRCWGPLSCRDFVTPWGPGDWAGVRTGELRICFAEVFWRAFAEGGREHELASTICHEALHIYFGRIIRDASERGRFGLATCYEGFVLLMNGFKVPQFMLDRCPSGLPQVAAM